MYNFETPPVNDGNYAAKVEAQKRKILSCYSNVADCVPQPLAKAEEAVPLQKAEKAKPITEPTTKSPYWTKINRLVDEINKTKNEVLAAGRRLSSKH
jgi:hypothetical protein